MFTRFAWAVVVFSICAWVSAHSWGGGGGPDLDMAMQALLGRS